ncbi:MAG: adenosylmethionine decarboxylase [Candidatus Bathyarchaeia archaeon]
MGIHVIAELLGVDPQRIARVDAVREILDRVVSESGLNCVSSSFHQFEPYGVSAIYLLSESHLSFHTWPEHGYVALDIFTCGRDEPALKAFRLIVKEFNPTVVRKRIIRRDLFAKGRSENFKRCGGVEEIRLGTA